MVAVEDIKSYIARNQERQVAKIKKIMTSEQKQYAEVFKELLERHNPDDREVAEIYELMSKLILK